jgi:hypothetical protein
VTLTLNHNVADCETAAATTRARNFRNALETLCAVLALVGLGYALMHSGGRDRGVTETAVALAAPALVVSRVWRTVATRELALAALLAGSAAVLPLVTPLGISYISDVGAYLYAVVLYVALRGYARDDERRRLLAVAVLVFGVVESTNVWRVWVGEHSLAFQIVGTFYWHNQFGIFAVVVGLLGTVMTMRSRRPEDAIAWLVAPAFLAMAVLSRSRGSELALAIAGSALIVSAATRREWWPLLRAAITAGIAYPVYLGFVAAASAAAGAAGPTGAVAPSLAPGWEPLTAAHSFRVGVSQASWQVFAHAPLLSHGFGSLAVEGWRWTPHGVSPAAFAHSAELQAVTDGGLLLGLPVALALAWAAWMALKGVVASARPATSLDWIRLGSAIALIAMLLHTSMDFDAEYPVLTALTALLLVLVVSGASRAERERPQASTVLRPLLVASIVVFTALGYLQVVSFWRTSDKLDLARTSMRTDSAVSVSIARDVLADHAFTDPRPAVFIVEATDLGYVFDDATLQRALGQSRDYAQVDTIFGTVWDHVSAEHAMTMSSTRAG